MNSDCPVCQIHKKLAPDEIVFENSDFIVRKEGRLPGYLYLEPKAHRQNYSEWTGPEFASFGETIQKAQAFLYENYTPLKVYTVCIAEKVPHMHFHLVPRYVENPKGLGYLELALEGRLDELSR